MLQSLATKPFRSEIMKLSFESWIVCEFAAFQSLRAPPLPRLLGFQALQATVFQQAHKSFQNLHRALTLQGFELSFFSGRNRCATIAEADLRWQDITKFGASFIIEWLGCKSLTPVKNAAKNRTRSPHHRCHSPTWLRSSAVASSKTFPGNMFEKTKG